jgi:hypothetical protein
VCLTWQSAGAVDNHIAQLTDCTDLIADLFSYALTKWRSIEPLLFAACFSFFAVCCHDQKSRILFSLVVCLVRFPTLVEFRNFGSFERQVIHQTFGPEDKTHDWIFDVPRIDRLASAQVDQSD